MKKTRLSLTAVLMKSTLIFVLFVLSGLSTADIKSGWQGSGANNATDWRNPRFALWFDNVPAGSQLTFTITLSSTSNNNIFLLDENGNGGGGDTGAINSRPKSSQGGSA